MTRFFETRNNALENWCNHTGRKIVDGFAQLDTDNFSGAYECKWQNKYEDLHVNLFCSLGDWACNITDLLKDNRFDRFYFEEKEEALVLFRYYTRIMLVISELLTDFQNIYLHSEILKPNFENNPAARKFYFSEDRITAILDYINNICKHKTQHIHVCNNHLNILFEDEGGNSKEIQCVSIYDLNMNKTKTAILVPKLEFFIETLVSCYEKLDAYFVKEPSKFEALCLKFGEKEVEEQIQRPRRIIKAP